MLGFVTVFIAGLLALATLLFEFFAGLWHSNNHCFFPLGLLAVAYLAYTRRLDVYERILGEDDSLVGLRRVGGSPAGIVIGFLLAVVMGLVAQLMHWPHLAWCAFLVLGWSVVYAHFGKLGLQAMAPILVLAFFFRPLPASSEPWMQLGLQSMTSGFASILLDLLSVFHFSDGVVLGLVSQETLAEPLCNGVRSIVLVTFLAIAWGIHYRYHPVRTVANVFFGIFWVIVGNSVRVAAILIHQDWGGTWFDSQVALLISEYAALGFMLFFLWSSDQLLASISVPRLQGLSITKSDLELWPIEGGWIGTPSAATWGVVAAFVVVAGLSLRLLPLNGALSSVEPSAETIAAFELPAEIDGWKVGEPETQESYWIDGSRPVAKNWTLERDGKQIQLQVRGWLPTYPGPRWRWFWYGWRLQPPDDGATSSDGNAKGVPADEERLDLEACKWILTRLPGESGFTVGVGLDKRREPLTETDLIAQWRHLPITLNSALQYAIGAKSLMDAQRDICANPYSSVSMSMMSGKLPAEPLRQEAVDVLRTILGRWQNLTNDSTSEGKSGDAATETVTKETGATETSATETSATEISATEISATDTGAKLSGDLEMKRSSTTLGE